MNRLMFVISMHNQDISADARIFPHLGDKISYLYVEHCRIEQEDSSIVLQQKGTRTPIPIGVIACLICGPGTTVTHRAIQACGDNQTLLVWSGEQMRTFYASGMYENKSSQNLLRQIDYFSNKHKHLEVARRMYANRFPGLDMSGMNMNQMRGAEGTRMKKLYQKLASEYNVQWNNRNYKSQDFDAQDDINKALTYGNHLLYNVCHAAIVTLGFSPAIGFIHSGSMRSFVYDVADLYKEFITITPAFRIMSDGYHVDLGSDIRQAVRAAMQEHKLLKCVTKDLYKMFEIDNAPETLSTGIWDNVITYQEFQSKTLWGQKNTI